MVLASSAGDWDEIKQSKTKQASTKSSIYDVSAAQKRQLSSCNGSDGETVPSPPGGVVCTGSSLAVDPLIPLRTPAGSCQQPRGLNTGPPAEVGNNARQPRVRGSATAMGFTRAAPCNVQVMKPLALCHVLLESWRRSSQTNGKLSPDQTDERKRSNDHIVSL
ncbi:hypothetical protein SJAG_05250 [Schizosaccharomyces japonicus yFS275]|uniref:Uncharacterized protein n=1 Tax=Schizosaccharomyces japonicus (strain yFS275 / FY16936) TaxID=402676 RepID=B6JZ95_SCHJY|nr:hypothetical protein SJAG_05250 [Schizosaccharomyces japonicus yFS275]EEB06863.1 hypothetical protein SJAG_05250 [Schizosaccharomyces japonicus yFS275]